MTHTLHRVGTKQNLADDYTFVILPAQGINSEGSDSKLRQYLHIALRHNPNNIGSDSSTEGGWYTHTTEQIIRNCHGEAHAVFSDKKDVIAFLKEVKKANLDMSVVLSGLLDEVNEICKQVGLTRHTVNFSLSYRGKVSKLPSREILEVTTMCGHHMISPNLVKVIVEDIKKGRKKVADGAKEIAKPCTCGCFNVVRAEKLLGAMAAKE
ncbi:MAG: hypothetical protein V1771_03595 [Chloroflexota bacterium]